MQMQALLVTNASVGWKTQWIRIYEKKIQYFTVKKQVWLGVENLGLIRELFTDRTDP